MLKKCSLFLYSDDRPRCSLIYWIISSVYHFWKKMLLCFFIPFHHWKYLTIYLKAFLSQSFKTDSQWEFVWFRELKQGLCNNLEGWDRERGSRGRENMYTYGWFMLIFGRKQQNYVKQISFNQKWILFKSEKNH